MATAARNSDALAGEWRLASTGRMDGSSPSAAATTSESVAMWGFLACSPRQQLAASAALVLEFACLLRLS